MEIGPTPGVHCGSNIRVRDGVTGGVVPEMIEFCAGGFNVGVTFRIGMCVEPLVLFWFCRFVTFDRRTVSSTGMVRSAVMNSKYRFLSGSARYQDIILS